VLEDERQIGSPRPEELQVDVLWEDAGAELSGRDLGSARVDVFQVGKHEPMLESIEEVGRHTLAGRQ
jgi:hypothetical protein